MNELEKSMKLKNEIINLINESKLQPIAVYYILEGIMEQIRLAFNNSLVENKVENEEKEEWSITIQISSST